MNLLILINYTIFAILLSLFSLELGAAVLSLANYDHYQRKIVSYIAPIWEITGTFSIFFIVNLVATYPGMVPVIGLYIAPVFLAAVFLIIRDSFLAYSEFADKKQSKRYARVYSACTLITMFLLVAVIGSVISGSGINLTTVSSNSLAIIFNPFSVGFFLSGIAFVSFCAVVFYEVHSLKYYFGTIIIAVIIAALTFLSATYILRDMWANLILFVPSAALLIVISALYIKRSKRVRFLILPFLFVSILAFEISTYPLLFNNSIDITMYLAPQVSQFYVLMVTMAGGLFLAIALSYFVYVHHLRIKKVKGKKGY